VWGANVRLNKSCMPKEFGITSTCNEMLILGQAQNSMILAQLEFQ
jgi:hypothetical protein